MRAGLTVSLVGHAALIAVSVLGFASTRKLQSGPVASIPVEIVSVGDTSESKLGARKGEAKREAVLDKRPAREAEAPREGPDKVKPQKSEAAAPPPPPPAEKPKHLAEAPPEPPKAKPQPKPEPVKPAEKAEAPKAEIPETLPAKKPQPKPESKLAEAAPPAPKPKPLPAKPAEKAAEKPAPTHPVSQHAERKFDSDKISALLNKTDPAPAARPPAPADNTASLGTAQGRGAKLTASEIDALRSRLYECWNIPAGARDAERLSVRVRFNLNPDGSLKSGPELVEATPGPYAQVATEAAMRAVRQCQPYTMLPAEKYETWRDITVNFDPREMFGG